MQEEDCESEALTPSKNKGPPRMDRSATSRGCWTQRTILEKSLIISLSVCTVSLVIISLLFANLIHKQNKTDIAMLASNQDTGKTSPYVSTEDGGSNHGPISKVIELDKVLEVATDSPLISSTVQETSTTTVRSTTPKGEYFKRKSAKENSVRFTMQEESDDSVEKIDSSLETSSKLDKSLRKKIEIAERRFAERYPRDHASSALKQIFQFVPRPLQKVVISETQQLSAQDKISEIIFSLDLDGNGSANAWELHDWMLWVEKRVHQHVVEDQWASLGLTGNHSLSWSAYHHKVHPYGLKDAKSKRRFARERRRWNHADKDDNDELTKSEFKKFLFPHLGDGVSASDVIVNEAHEALDVDYDGRVSLSEFVSVHRSSGVGSNPSADEENRPESVYFKSHLDSDMSGFLDVEEISQWVEPTGFIQAKSEVIYLMQHLDTDDDKQISLEEAFAKPDVFLKSQVTFFGQIYQLKNLRSEVFHLPSNNNSY